MSRVPRPVFAICRWTSGLVAAGLFLPSCRPFQTAAVPAPVRAADSAAHAAILREKSIDVAGLPAQSVGVVPFRVTSADPGLGVLGFGLADLVITDLARSKRLVVVERLRIDALLRELDLSTTGVVDTTQAARFGKLLGARTLVLGSLTTTGDQARLGGHLGDIRTGKLRSAGDRNTTLDQVLDAEKDLVLDLFQALGVALTPAERTLVEQRPTKSLAALLAYSRGVRSEVLRDYPGARAQYRDAIRRDPNFTTAKTRLDLLDQMAATGFDFSSQAGSLAVEGINRSTLPTSFGATDPAFWQRLITTIIIIVDVP